jgi:hypothetical protein
LHKTNGTADWERGVVGVLVFAGALATIWSIFKHQTAYATLISSMPPEFQRGDISRHAFGVIVLSPSTPSELQWDYVTSQAGLCFAALCFALACYFAGRTDGAVLLSLGSLVGAYSTIRSWTAYRRNRNRTSVHDDANDG